MSKAPDKPREIVIVGGGISGLATAHALVTQARIRGDQIKVTLICAAERFGGVIRTTYKDGYILDEGPDCFITTKPEAMQLAKELGIEDQLIPTTEGFRQSFILHKGTLKPVPKGFFLLAPTSLSALQKTPLLSWPGKLRAAMDFIIPKRKASADMVDDESLASFVSRRLGSEVLDRIAQPMVAGIYTADPERLSLRATFPDFLKMEEEHGSVIRGMLAKASMRKAQSAGTQGAKQASGARYGMFRSFRLGMGQLVSELIKSLEEAGVTLRRETILRKVSRSGEGYRLMLQGGEVIECDQLCLAMQSRVSGRFMRASDDAELQSLGELLRATEYASASICSLAYDRKQVEHSLEGMGFVVPAVEGRKLIACSFSHRKWQGRAPEGKVLLRAFIGGAMQGDLVGLSQREIARMAHSEVAELLGITGEPEMTHVSRWRNAMPQYHVGHVDRVEEMREAEAKTTNFAMAGNGFDGVGIPDCIRNAKRAAKRLLDA